MPSYFRQAELEGVPIPTETQVVELPVPTYQGEREHGSGPHEVWKTHLGLANWQTLWADDGMCYRLHNYVTGDPNDRTTQKIHLERTHNFCGWRWRKAA
jgi:hypothetical protein